MSQGVSGEQASYGEIEPTETYDPNEFVHSIHADLSLAQQALESAYDVEEYETNGLDANPAILQREEDMENGHRTLDEEYDRTPFLLWMYDDAADAVTDLFRRGNTTFESDPDDAVELGRIRFDEPAPYNGHGSDAVQVTYQLTDDRERRMAVENNGIRLSDDETQQYIKDIGKTLTDAGFTTTLPTENGSVLYNGEDSSHYNPVPADD